MPRNFSIRRAKRSETKLSRPDFLEARNPLQVFRVKDRCNRYREPFISKWSLGIDDPFKFIVNRGATATSISS